MHCSSCLSASKAVFLRCPPGPRNNVEFYCLLLQVCNHPDLFEGRPIVSAYDIPAINIRVPSSLAFGNEASRLALARTGYDTSGEGWQELEVGKGRAAAHCCLCVELSLC